ncbi:hypothetical protein EJ074_08005 [Mesorhizobium sp. M3A.F.Ca.ET.080.04.2.1]|uniref:hypothetical protein n=1 Tax=Mesorhizobium sp. M3A.F.Ca.ET.080.04.2.1 TaxID=2493676 RepID=UPI000F753DEE|nr:hypothetical protein [Mesorhizobium sp. M3A.F.Ca.ET.080.04.2.1]AZO09058.1 hypothetical protein EJ074_08005 [Mesorhizobium sp. M3A.F.Ca.ET.080.04.2.1]
MLKDSVPCPIPTNRKRCAPRRSFELDITHEAAPFNQDRIEERALWTLSGGVVAQMTRFGLTAKALVNQSGLAGPPSNRIRRQLAGIAARQPSRPPGNRLGIAAWHEMVSDELQIFGVYGARLLIVSALFFIQRRDGEVAEWSKALPC